jgi:hypothetical protein
MKATGKTMKRLALAILAATTYCLGHQSAAAEPTKLAFDTYGGYFVSNKFEPNAENSFTVIKDKEQFDKVFGVAFVMRDKSHRLSKDAFESLMVVAAIKRGNATVEYKVESVTETNGVVELKYTTTATKSGAATFACPLIVSIPKSDYKAIQFVENGKPAKKFELASSTQQGKKPSYKGKMLSEWIALTGDNDYKVRMSAAFALGQIGPDASTAIPALIALLKDKEDYVRCEAAGALGKTGPDTRIAIAALTGSLNDSFMWVRSRSAQALGKIGPEAKTAIPSLIGLLKDKTITVRTSAIEALGRIGPEAKTAIPSLTELLKDKDENIRKAATESLEKIKKEKTPPRP